MDDYPAQLGDYFQHIATASKEAQTWFNRGWVWASAYHREEACFCFSEAAKADPDCAMAHWGIAFCNGPDYNFSHAPGTLEGFYSVAAQSEGYPSANVAVNAVAKAAELSVAGPPRERALVAALLARYEWPVTSTTPDLQVDFANAMERVSEEFPQDSDVAAIYAEAIMCLAPWDLYEKKDGATSPNWRSSDKQLKAIGKRAKVAIDRGLHANPSHIWLNHLKIHLNEMGPIGDFDWAAAEHVRASDATGAGHLIHMPTHLDIQVGNYTEAIRCNILGYEADLALYKASPSRFNIYTGYVVHNLEFCVWAAMYAGCKQAALTAAEKIDEKFLTPERLRASPMLATFFESYTVTRLMVLVRFGMWEELVSIPFRDDSALHLSHTIFLHFARGIALGVRSEVAAAKEEQRSFEEMRCKLKPGDRLHHNVNLLQMADIASAVLDGEIKYRESNFDDAFASLKLGVARFDALPYDEPHGWLMSTRQTLGALLAEQGRHAQAVEAYLEDLELFPKNPWALAGLIRCFSAIGDPRLSETKQALSTALEGADVVIDASCACAEGWDGSIPCCNTKE